MWRAKTERRIAELCRASWLWSNTKANGERYFRHVPYTVPTEAAYLIDCLGMANQAEGEARAKAVFVHGYNGEG